MIKGLSERVLFQTCLSISSLTKFKFVRHDLMFSANRLFARNQSKWNIISHCKPTWHHWVSLMFGYETWLVWLTTKMPCFKTNTFSVLWKFSTFMQNHLRYHRHLSIQSGTNNLKIVFQRGLTGLLKTYHYG